MIKIDDTYSIEADERSYNVVKTMVTKEGKKNGKKEEKTYKITLAYCCTLDDALQWIINKKHRDFIAQGEITLGQALNELNNIIEQVENLIK